MDLTYLLLFWLSLLRIFHFRKIWFFYHLSSTFLWLGCRWRHWDDRKRFLSARGLCLSPFGCPVTSLVGFSTNQGYLKISRILFSHFSLILKFESQCHMSILGLLYLFMINLNLRNKLVSHPLFECGWRFFLLIFILFFIHFIKFWEGKFFNVV